MQSQVNNLLKKFKRGDRLNLIELKYLNKCLYSLLRKTQSEETKSGLTRDIAEVQDDIDYWLEIEKVHPFASQEKYVK